MIIAKLSPLSVKVCQSHLPRYSITPQNASISEEMENTKRRVLSIVKDSFASSEALETRPGSLYAQDVTHFLPSRTHAMTPGGGPI